MREKILSGNTWTPAWSQSIKASETSKIQHIDPNGTVDLQKSSNSTNQVCQQFFSNSRKMASTDGDIVPLEVSFITTIIINTITCPFVVLLNIQVIIAVKTRPRLQTNSNILLACLAVTDALTGLLGQPSYILWTIFQLSGLSSSKTVGRFHFNVALTFAVASCLHLILVTFERLIAIKFTVHYPNIVTGNNMMIAVIVVWIIAFICNICQALKLYLVLYYMVGLIGISCILFVAFTYMILYHETRRHQRKIKAQQVPQEEVERFTKENKALQTTVLVVGGVIICLLPVCFCLIVVATGLYSFCPINGSMWQTCSMLNSLVNPLIYCWRQKAIRKLVFTHCRRRTQVVQPATQWRGGISQREWKKKLLSFCFIWELHFWLGESILLPHA